MERDRDPHAAVDRAWLDIPDPVRLPAASQDVRRLPPTAPSPTRAQVRKTRFVTIVGCIAWSAIIVGLWGLRPDAHEVTAFLVLQLVVWTALIVTAARTALASGDRGLGKPVLLVALVAVAVPLTFVVLGLWWRSEGAAGTLLETGTFSQFQGCAGLGLLAVVPMLGLSAWALRRSFASAAAWRGGAWGAALGLLASTILTLHCGVTFGGHIVLAHGAPLVLATLAGAIIGSKLAKA